ncbi:MAG: glycosyltransferase family 4 protein [Saprospiraceae bacterium]
MKILVISNYRETVSVRPEAEMFIGLQRTGVDITVMTYGDAKYVEQFKVAGIQVIDFHPEKKLNKKEIKIIREELIRGKYDILHLFNSKAIINGIQAAKGLPVKVVLYRGYTGNIHWYEPTAYFKYLHPRVDKIWCIAESIEKDIKRQLFFDKNRPVTIHKGHDENWYKNIEAIDRKELKEIPADAFWIVNVANKRRMKGTEFLLNAMQYIPTDLPIHLILVGKNLDHAKNKAIANNSPNKNKIHFLGYRTDVLNIVKASDVFVLSSIFGEATTKAVIEAMSLGTSPIITDISGNKGLVVDGKCGLVVPPKNAKAIAEAVLKLFNDRKLCEEYGQRAQAHIAKHFNIKTTVLEIKKMYETLLRADK